MLLSTFISGTFFALIFLSLPHVAILKFFNVKVHIIWYLAIGFILTSTAWTLGGRAAALLPDIKPRIAGVIATIPLNVFILYNAFNRAKEIFIFLILVIVINPIIAYSSFSFIKKADNPSNKIYLLIGVLSTNYYLHIPFIIFFWDIALRRTLGEENLAQLN